MSLLLQRVCDQECPQRGVGQERGLGLTRAMKTRAVIEQAKRIVMALRGVSVDRAFEILVAQSQQEHIRLAEVAHRIAESVTTNPE
ncbi:ANTAR domain-containing protein [Rhodococcus sp. NPDC127530]|uniref:ANTAR domain-containing protein n=1 Tax=unclassified Rhodococcus (in: high G+C Gram-positive bacteria) TaxID=192944 RepID=UPI00363A551B